MAKQIAAKHDVELPELSEVFLPSIHGLTRSLGVPREVLASDDQISQVWSSLPRELKDIPSSLRDELVAKMCVAASVGLFDGAINYIWNAAIVRLRGKIINFGLQVIAQILQKDFEEYHLSDLQDNELLELCHKLNIIDEDGFLFLDQCRNTRNNFSAAHPPAGALNDRELLVFLNRCIRYALSDSTTVRGVEISQYISSLKGARFSSAQRDFWTDRLNSTYDAQRQMLVNMAHGIYCDPNSAEHSRLNALDVCLALRDNFSAATKSSIINQHDQYVSKGDTQRHSASVTFFTKLNLIILLNGSEQHAIFTKAIDHLWRIHNGMNNFYNEPPFAENLLTISKQSAVPKTVQEQFVTTIACCYVGNGYGVSNAAVSKYSELIRGFSPEEILLLIRLGSTSDNPLGRRVETYPTCRHRLAGALELIDKESIPSSGLSYYNKLVRK